MMKHDDPVENLARLLRRHLGDALAPAQRFSDMFTPDGAMEFPYAPDGFPARLRGRQEIESHARMVSELLSIGEMFDVEALVSQEGTMAMLEFRGEGMVRATGKPYLQRYVSVITLRDGRIALYRDYWNPLVVMAAMGENKP
ncbi:MAG: ketosteroid isomerase-like protein [Solidesulfovibrio magneticus str. Maddingley MBC34]|uniref:Ketosteroid isomerase-like protein n=1 Tax=Solidesulfovibrio magneticus str. Maddingley MBC34 TaxID=1206767 RepID=K6GB22_9BACT|nr:MAG: ketosteroid isomerase-like protein [Solidesulfovibrio magneticus str. Maddingley MBC34]